MTRPAEHEEARHFRRLHDTDRYARHIASWNPLGLFYFEEAMIRDALGSPGGRRVLVVGSGTGRGLSDLKAMGFDVVGVDHARRPLVHAKDHASGVALSQGDLTGLPFKTGLFDVVLAFNALSGVQTEQEREKSMEECLRVLRPGGVFLAWDVLRCLYPVWVRQWLRGWPRKLGFLFRGEFPLSEYPREQGFVGDTYLGRGGTARRWDRTALVALEVAGAFRTLGILSVCALHRLKNVGRLFSDDVLGWRWLNSGVPIHSFRETELTSLFRRAGFEVVEAGKLVFGEWHPLHDIAYKVAARSPSPDLPKGPAGAKGGGAPRGGRAAGFP